ncbi:MAG: transcription-repair coupling factor, partial [Firmicutes bacterium]|nr:transcription-repair coupling factor [Bacillota bacterium]
RSAEAGRGAEDGLGELPAPLTQAVRRGKERPPAELLREKVEEALERLGSGLYFEGLEQYLPYFFDQSATLLDYFPRDLLVVVDEPARVKEAAEEADLQTRERQTRWLEAGGLLPGQTKLALSYGDWAYHLSGRTAIGFSLLLKAVAGSQPQNIVSVAPKPMQLFHGQWPMFKEELDRWRDQKYSVVCFVATEDRAARLREALADSDVTATVTSSLEDLQPGQVVITVGGLETGFQWPALRLTAVTDGEIFGRPKTRRRSQSAPPRAAEDDSGQRAIRISSVRDLKVGDFVVHVNHGIGKYLGIQTETILGVTRDYLVIRYEGADRLKIPTDQIHLVQKYVGSEGHEPRLNKLGGGDWSRVKARVKESIQKMAIELLRLEALRESQPGFAYSPDSVWQKEFEDAFKYEETPDQLRAAGEIKRDMEKARPMDRLLCGDVGYGKTEVALRAVFKAIQDGKQAAVLVPTTILAQQHYNTFAERFSGYPVELGLLSRFRSPRQQEETLRRMAAGEVDVIIGTHRLLSEDVRFKDLGLLIVDEEQRFGVAHKEKIKLLRSNVDVLTLSATPIPRTMHMAMVGMRDISVIETPPEDRFPVETYVAEYNDELVRDAIGRELARGGQVYFLHNRVQTIERAASRVQTLLPDARVLFAHGQMREDQLEKVMLEFLDGEAGVLVTTTIIESGLDIANVNTLVVEDSDHLGLSQLYQLRGRVGRSNRLAYAYFLYRKDKVLTEVAEKRLQAIREFTEFGAGFKIALRDLEIRGAGNILGPEQHGFIISVGFDLYTQLLDETVRELKGEKVEPVPEPALELAVDAYIPDAYVPDPRQKIEAYQRIMAVRRPTDAYDVEDELEDRYGAAPRPVLNLLAISRLKAMCREAGVVGLSQAKDRLTLRFAERPFIAADRLSALNRQLRGRLALSQGRTSPTLTARVVTSHTDQLLEALEQLLPQLSGVVLAPSGVLQ